MAYRLAAVDVRTLAVVFGNSHGRPVGFVVFGSHDLPSGSFSSGVARKVVEVAAPSD